MRVYVGPDEALVVTNKFGQPLPPDRIVVPADDNQFKGVQEAVRGPGRYFLNPVEYEWQTVPLIEIPAGDPQSWQWNEDGTLKNPETAPKIGLVSAQAGQGAGSGVGSRRSRREGRAEGSAHARHVQDQSVS